jgi:hypothetical protein
MEPDLWGGGSTEGKFNCILKQYAVLTGVVQATGKYVTAGPGLCMTPWDTKPASWYLGKVSRTQCRQTCSGDSKCTGFSWQPSGECANFYEAGLRSSKAALPGNIACYVKDFMQAPDSVDASGQVTFSPNVGNPNSYNTMPPTVLPTASTPAPFAPAAVPGTQTTGPSLSSKVAAAAGGVAAGAAAGAVLAAAASDAGSALPKTAAEVEVEKEGAEGVVAKKESARERNFMFWTPSTGGSATCHLDRPKPDMFPGKDANQSNAAWPSGHQPAKGECWPKDKSTNEYKACWYTKELFDTQRGWPGKCSGLLRILPQTLGGLSCQEHCLRNPHCPVWQTSWVTGDTHPLCRQGAGTDCPGMRSGDRANIDRAARIQHGAIRVLMSLKGLEVNNMRQDFDAEYYRRRNDGIEACKFLCYSNIDCQYWLFSSTDGCFVEDPPMHTVPYPLLQKHVKSDSEFARSVIRGEYILHRCPEHDGPYSEKDEHAKFSMLPWQWNWFTFHWPWDKGGWTWWQYILFLMLSCCCCGCCLLFCGCLGLLRHSAIDGKAAVKDIKGKMKSKSRSAAEVSDSESSSSSDSDSRSSRGQQNQSLLKNQHFDALGQGQGHQARTQFHSAAGRPGMSAQYR